MEGREEMQGEGRWKELFMDRGRHAASREDGYEGRVALRIIIKAVADTIVMKGAWPELDCGGCG